MKLVELDLIQNQIEKMLKNEDFFFPLYVHCLHNRLKYILVSKIFLIKCSHFKFNSSNQTFVAHPLD
jgi:hypothetical protein